MRAVGQKTLDKSVSTFPYCGLSRTNGLCQEAANTAAIVPPTSPQNTPNLPTDMFLMTPSIITPGIPVPSSRFILTLFRIILIPCVPNICPLRSRTAIDG